VCAPTARIACLAAGAALAAVACGQLPAPETSSVESPIVGGSPDTTHDAVMALVNQLSATTATACSGTTIALVGASGIFLTAGHCVVANDGMGHVTVPISVAAPQNLFVVPGPDWQQSVQAGLYYGVAQVEVHPQYDGAVDSPYDVAVVRFLGALPANPVIPAMQASEDQLTVGSGITVVGFGKTTTNAMNTTRYEVDRTIQTITTNQFIYDQTDGKGACEGDSGGPALATTPSGTRVAGITSFGDPTCTMEGASVRISPVYSTFIQPFIKAAPTTLSCSDCALAIVAPGNACVSESAACATQSSACGKFLTCAMSCTNSGCIGQCQSANPSGATAYEAVANCQCGGACQAICATSQQCGGTSGGSLMCSDFTDSRPACQSCIQNSCCNQRIACANDPTCSSCLVEATSQACRLNSAFAGITQCMANCSGQPCSSTSTSNGGSTSSGPGAGGMIAQQGGKSGCSYADPAPGPNAALAALLALAFAAARSRSVKARAVRARPRRQ
jgi:V8-like Glu-specific endopeptidase